MTDILVTRDILGAAHPHGDITLVNLYAAMPSLHVAWAAWCALAIFTASRGRWRGLAWLYPAATTLVVLASANHFLLDAAGGLAVAGLGVLATGRPSHLLAWRHARAARPRAQYSVRTGPWPFPVPGDVPAAGGQARQRWVVPGGGRWHSGAHPPVTTGRRSASQAGWLARSSRAWPGELWMAVDGLWAAAAVGLYMVVRHPGGFSPSARRLVPETAWGES
jgi:hypothetical protein